MTTCEIFVADWDGLVSRGTITADGVKLTAHPNKGSEVLFDNIVKDRGEQDPETWLKSLPAEYNSWTMQAKIVKPVSNTDAAILRKVIDSL